MITLNQLQQELRQWQGHNFPKREAWEPLVGLQEELGELSHAFLKMHQGIRRGEDHAEKLRDACADIVVYLCDFCNATGVDLQGEIDKVWPTVRKRDWIKYPINGVTE